MKRIVFGIIIFVFVILLFGCAKEKTETPVQEDIEYELSLCTSELVLYVGETYEFTVNTNFKGELEYELSNGNVSIDGNKLTGVKAGKCNLYVGFEANNDYYSKKMAIVIKELTIKSIDEINLLVGEEFSFIVNSNYDGEFELIYDKEAIEVSKVENNYHVLGLKAGDYSIGFKVPGFDLDYNLNVNVFIKESCNVTVDDNTVRVAKGRTLVDILYEMFGNQLSTPPLTYSLVDYFYDNSFLNVCKLDTIIDSDIELFPKYEKMQYTISLNKVVRYKSTCNLGQDVVAISQVAGYELSDFDLAPYTTYEVRYDIPTNKYVITNEEARYIPYDGFVLAVRTESDRFSELRSVLKKGLVIDLDSYNIIATSKLYINREPQAFSYDPITFETNCKFISLFDVTNNYLIYDKKGDDLAYPASTTKIITAMAALRYCGLNDSYKVGAELNLCYEAPSPSVAGLSQGEIWSLRDLLYALMLPSGNDAAYTVGALTIANAFPDYKGTTRQKLDFFAKLMNDIAKDCGATNSHFMVPDGNSYYTETGERDDRFTYHYTTANDMVKISCYAMSFSTIAEVVRTTYYRCQIGSKTYSLSNTNSMITEGSGYYYSGACGLKTGYTGAAGRCLITACFKKGRFIIVACMNASSGDARNNDTRNLLNAAYKN